ncbi:MAG: hypothetical protein NVS1B6_01830 [Steroidobacteraceae bacterium]
MIRIGVCTFMLSSRKVFATYEASPWIHPERLRPWGTALEASTLNSDTPMTGHAALIAKCFLRAGECQWGDVRFTLVPDDRKKTYRASTLRRRPAAGCYVLTRGSASITASTE